MKGGTPSGGIFRPLGQGVNLSIMGGDPKELFQPLGSVVQGSSSAVTRRNRHVILFSLDSNMPPRELQCKIRHRLHSLLGWLLQ